MSKSNKVRLSNSRLNSYKTRVLTEGLDAEQYQKNPVLLFMHRRGEVIGYVKGYRVEGDEVFGELVFDEASELSRRCKKQWEVGSLRMVSIGIDIIEVSDDPMYLVEGQTRPTITKSRLIEVSVVDVGSNDDAIALHKNGVRMELWKDAENVLPLLHCNNPIKETKEMDLSKIALALGLKEDADEASVLHRIGELKAKESEAKFLKEENETLEASRIDSIVEGAIAEKRIDLSKKGQFVELGKKIGAEELKKTFEAMAPQVKLSSMVPGSDGGGAPQSYAKLSEVPADKLELLRKENPSEYKRLFKAEYGYECDLD